MMQKISIHALREEGDVYGYEMGLEFNRISIHALREEGDVAVDTHENAEK